MATMNFSKFQTNIFNEVENGRTNLAINAVAGSGKTTTIVECCKRLRMRKFDVKFLAFNKSIVTELQTKIGDFADVSTLHSFGFSVLKKANPKVQSNPRKYSLAIRQEVNCKIESGLVSKEDGIRMANNATKLFNLCRVNLIPAGDMQAMQAIAEEHTIDVISSEFQIVNEFLKTAYEIGDTNEVDFTDMIVLPATTYKKYVPKYKVVFIDECQDLNAAQRELMLAAAQRGRFVAVGDRQQAINGFAGADCNSFNKIANLPNTKELPLSVNYRCGRKMIELAQQIVPAIQAHEGAIEGVVESINDLELSTFKPNDMVLCRTSAPLVAMCLKLIRHGVTAVVKGRDIAEGLISLIDKSKAKTIKGFTSWSETELRKLANEIAKKDKITPAEAEETGRYIAYNDRIQCILTIGENVTNLEGVKSYIQQIFSDEKIVNAVTLSTCHKAKGLEANRVIILLPNKLPLTWKGQLDWQYEQEMNLKYVAITRAKKELVIVNMEQSQLFALSFDK